MVDLGSLIPIGFEVVNASGQLTNAATITLTITLPDGSTTSPTVTNPPTTVGVYAYDYVTTQAGRHTWRVTTTGPTSAYGPVVFHVDPSAPGPILGLDQVKRHLNMDPTRADDDDELRQVIDAATVVVEDIVGPVVVRSFTEVHDPGPMLVLDRAPVLSLTTLSPVLTGGTAYQSVDLDFDADTGIVRRLDGGRFAGPLRVTYTAGRRVVPPNIVQGGLEIVRHMWDTQRGHAGARPGLGDEELVPTGSGWTVPRRVVELLAPHRKAPVVA